MNSFRVMGIDLSYRATGVAVLDARDGVSELMLTTCLKNKELGTGFNSFRSAAHSMKVNTLDRIKALRVLYEPDVVIVEVPCFTQSAKSAIAIGMCWGNVAHIRAAILIEPSVLKKWSGSKKGDKKLKVKDKVLERVTLRPSDASDDNIVDAIGIGFMFIDLVRTVNYETIK